MIPYLENILIDLQRVNISRNWFKPELIDVTASRSVHSSSLEGAVMQFVFSKLAHYFVVASKNNAFELVEMECYSLLRNDGTTWELKCLHFAFYTVTNVSPMIVIIISTITFPHLICALKRGRGNRVVQGHNFPEMCT